MKQSKHRQAQTKHHDAPLFELTECYETRLKIETATTALCTRWEYRTIKKG
jgi:hypothetical protein